VWSCVLAGGPAVGKSMLAGLAGAAVTGSARKVKQIDCNFFQSEHSIQSLVGSPMSYIGYGEGGVLQNFLKQNPDGVLVFKKPEFGHPSIVRVMHGILAGEFTAGDGQKISTHGLVVFATTGVDAGENRAPIGFKTEAGQREFVPGKGFHELFPPGLDVYFMDCLEPAALRNILRLAIRRYACEEGVSIGVEGAVLDALLEKVNQRLEGARGVLAAYRRRIEPLLDEQLESGKRKGRFRLCLSEDRQIVCRADDQQPAAPAGAGEEEIGHAE
jgi:ATP-dependent Clp protease ATP-binding subunit ClpA